MSETEEPSIMETQPTATITRKSILPPSATKSSSTKRWHQHLTLDLILYVLSRSIFHPAICMIFYLCIAAVHKHRTPLAYYTLYYTAFLALVESLLYLNRKLTFGFHARKVNWEEEVVVITGGGSGLGRTLAEMLVMSKKGVKVAVLDVKEPDEEAREWMRDREGTFWWGCVDVRNSAAVRIMAGRMKEELGSPTILVNNAAAPIFGLPLIPSETSYTLTPQDATRTLTVNTISHFNTLSAFLPTLSSAKNGGTIVTISSLLAHLSPTRIADYSASKAAISSLHYSLTHEIATHPSVEVRQNLKTVLVEPGQLSTQLFSDITSVPWYANFFGPVLEAKDVAKAIMTKLDSGENGVIRMPFYSKCMPLYAAMPGSMQRLMRWFSGIDRAIVPSKKRD